MRRGIGGADPTASLDRRGAGEQLPHGGSRSSFPGPDNGHGRLPCREPDRTPGAGGAGQEERAGNPARNALHFTAIDSTSGSASPTTDRHRSRPDLKRDSRVAPMRNESIVTPPLDTRAVPPCRCTAPATTIRLRIALVESYRRARRRLPRRPLRAVPRRGARADRGHDRRADPSRRPCVLRGRRGHPPDLQGVLARGDYADEVLADEPFAFGARDHRLGRRPPRAGAREPRRPRPSRPFRRRARPPIPSR